MARLHRGPARLQQDQADSLQPALASQAAFASGDNNWQV
jgi:hypothetical protein